jgi:hypothetical protein
MSDVTRRLSRWKAKYSPEIAAQTTARIFDDMTERSEASISANSSLLTANFSSPRLCPAALPPLARPDHLRPDAGERSPGATGEVAEPRRGHIRDAFLASLRGRVPFCKSSPPSAPTSSTSPRPRRNEGTLSARSGAANCGPRAASLSAPGLTRVPGIRNLLSGPPPPPPNSALYLGGGFLSRFLGVAPPIDNHPEPAMLT